MVVKVNYSDSFTVITNGIVIRLAMVAGFEYFRSIDAKQVDFKIVVDGILAAFYVE
jgi:hypothetical protein